MRKLQHHPPLRVIVLVAAFALSGIDLSAQDVQAQWQLSTEEAMVGQGVTLTLQVAGLDKIDPPKLKIPGVTAEWQGGSPHNSTSIVSVNGKTTTTTEKAFVGAWTLKASAPGTYHLDALDWRVGGKVIQLSALDWTVTPAKKNSNYALRQEASPLVGVPGVEIDYKLIWYLGQSAQNLELTLPILDNPNFEVIEDSLKAGGGDIVQVSYRGHTLNFIKGSGKLNGRQYTTLTAHFKLKATAPGKVDLAGTCASFDGQVGTRQGQDFFGNIVNEPDYQSLVATANPLEITVRDLPSQGKPNPFSGLIGKLSLNWSGARDSYRVGEPIRLGLSLSGAQNKPNLDLDYMVINALSGSDFQVSSDSAVQVSPNATADSGGRPSISRPYVLRARRAGRLTLPALKLNYFDPDSNRYAETRTPPLVLNIEGSAADQAAANAAPGSDAGASPDEADAQTLNAEGASVAQKDGGSLDVSPPGLIGGNKKHFPWWWLTLPGFIGGASCAAIGLWLRSKARRIKLERQAWASSLQPLNAKGGREALETGRARLKALLEPGELWGARLESIGKREWLESRMREWDLAFFSNSRDDEPWLERWEEIKKEAGGWR